VRWFSLQICLVLFVPYSISPNIREGLLEAFYGVYEKDPEKVDSFHDPCLYEYHTISHYLLKYLPNEACVLVY